MSLNLVSRRTLTLHLCSGTYVLGIGIDTTIMYVPSNTVVSVALINDPLDNAHNSGHLFHIDFAHFLVKAYNTRSVILHIYRLA